MRRMWCMCGCAAVCGAGALAAEIQVTGGPTRADSAYAPRHLVDNDPASEWAGDPQADAWQLAFDLGECREIARVRVEFTSAKTLAREINGDISTDGESWQALGALPMSTPTDLHVAQPMRFFRLTLQGKLGGRAPQIRNVVFATEDTAAESVDSEIREILYPSDADDTLQPARYFPGDRTRPVPLVVGLHTWSGTYRQRYMPRIETHCVASGWAYIHPDFRGPNRTPAATGSELVVRDILSAVRHARQAGNIDPRRIYLVGGSGGGYHALLLAGRAPEVWTAVSAWVPISDLAAWYRECRERKSGYADHIVRSCGGAPGDSAAVDAELRRRSPITHLANARGLPLDINAGIHDGHKGSVPISHSLIAFNCVALPEDRIAASDIAFMTEQQAVPAHLQETLEDASYGAHAPLFRRRSDAVRITLFEGGHQVVESAALAWLSAQIKPDSAGISGQ